MRRRLHCAHALDGEHCRPLSTSSVCSDSLWYLINVVSGLAPFAAVSYRILSQTTAYMLMLVFMTYNIGTTVVHLLPYTQL